MPKRTKYIHDALNPKKRGFTLINKRDTAQGHFYTYRINDNGDRIVGCQCLICGKSISAKNIPGSIDRKKPRSEYKRTTTKRNGFTIVIGVHQACSELNDCDEKTRSYAIEQLYGAMLFNRQNHGTSGITDVVDRLKKQKKSELEKNDSGKIYDEFKHARNSASIATNAFDIATRQLDDLRFQINSIDSCIQRLTQNSTTYRSVPDDNFSDELDQMQQYQNDKVKLNGELTEATNVYHSTRIQRDKQNKEVKRIEKIINEINCKYEHELRWIDYMKFKFSIGTDDDGDDKAIVELTD